MKKKKAKAPEWYEKAIAKYENIYDPVKLHGNRLDLNRESVFRLGLIHCTVEECAAVIGCGPSHIKARFMADLRRGHEEGQMSIKRKMHEKAMTGPGDTSMLIFLSKQRCGYRDRMPDEGPQVAFSVFVDQVPK